MKFSILIGLFLIVSFGFTPRADTDEWITDYEKAFVIAKLENKHVLINFTGSDWCGWCKRLDREVFSQPAFKEYAKENLVLLKIDFPRRTPQSREVKIKNQGYAKMFAVRGFPSIFIVKSNQRVVLRTGYKAGGADNYISHISRMIR